MAADAYNDKVARAVRRLRRADPRFIPVIEAAGPCGLVSEPRETLFFALGKAIVYQQLSGKAAATIFARVCGLFPGSSRGFTPARVLATADEALRGAGLSRNKLLSLRDLAGRIESGELPGLAALRRQEDEQVVSALITVRGIGRWTAEMFLMFKLSRLDVLAVDDLGLRQGYAILAGTGSEASREQLALAGEQWRPFRSVASWYLWRAVEVHRRQAQHAQQ